MSGEGHETAAGVTSLRRDVATGLPGPVVHVLGKRVLPVAAQLQPPALRAALRTDWGDARGQREGMCACCTPTSKPKSASIWGLWALL